MDHKAISLFTYILTIHCINFSLMLIKKTDCCWWEGLEKRKFLSLIKLLKTEHRVNAVILPLVHLGEATEHKVHKAGQWIFLKLPAVLETIKDRGFGWLFLFYKLKLNWKSMVKVLSSNYWFCNWPSLHIGSNRNLSGFFSPDKINRLYRHWQNRESNWVLLFWEVNNHISH